MIRLCPHQSGVFLYNHDTVGMRHWYRGRVPFISVVINCEQTLQHVAIACLAGSEDVLGKNVFERRGLYAEVPK